MQMLRMGQPGIRVMAKRLELAITMPCIPLPCLWLQHPIWPALGGPMAGVRLETSWKRLLFPLIHLCEPFALPGATSCL